MTFDVGGARYLSSLQLSLADPPAGLSVKSASPGKDGLDVVLQADAAKSKPGTRGNLVLEVHAKGPFAKAGSGKRQVATLPAFAFEVVEK